MVTVSLERFVATGSFGPISPGCSRGDVRAAFGEPEATGGASRKYRCDNLWKFGDVEFFFERPESGLLEMIFMDHFNGPGRTPEGWGGLSVDSWIVREEAPFDEFVKQLDELNICYSIGTGFVPNQTALIFPSGVKIEFVHKPSGHSDLLGLAFLQRGNCRG